MYADIDIGLCVKTELPSTVVEFSTLWLQTSNTSNPTYSNRSASDLCTHAEKCVKACVLNVCFVGSINITQSPKHSGEATIIIYSPAPSEYNHLTSAYPDRPEEANKKKKIFPTSHHVITIKANLCARSGRAAPERDQSAHDKFN